MNSRAFEAHLVFLNNADLLELPKASDDNYSLKFAEENAIKSVPLPHLRRKAMKKGADMVGAIRSDSGMDGIGAAEDSGEGNNSGEGGGSGERDDSGECNDSREDQDSGECNDLEENDQDEEHQALHNNLETEHVTTVVCGWMKTFISHYAAKRILEHHFVLSI